jgi:hypothetical protein
MDKETFDKRQQKFLKLQNRFYLEECGCCGCYHKPDYTEDCRNDAERFSDPADYARKYWAKALAECNGEVKKEKILPAGFVQYGAKVVFEYIGAKVVFEYIGEGTNGDYNPDDEFDMPLFRFYVYYSENGGFDWEEADDASYCTTIPIDTPKETMEKLAQIIFDRVKMPLIAGNSIKKICEELSWIDESWIK